MTREEFEAIVEKEQTPGFEQPPCRVLTGLEIMRKYIPDAKIDGADHDVVYSVDADKLVEAAITEDDAHMLLCNLGWHIDDGGEYMECYV